MAAFRYTLQLNICNRAGLENPGHTPTNGIRPVKNARVSNSPFTFGLPTAMMGLAHNTPTFGRVMPRSQDSRCESSPWQRCTASQRHQKAHDSSANRLPYSLAMGLPQRTSGSTRAGPCGGRVHCSDRGPHLQRLRSWLLCTSLPQCCFRKRFRGLELHQQAQAPHLHCTSLFSATGPSTLLLRIWMRTSACSKARAPPRMAHSRLDLARHRSLCSYTLRAAARTHRTSTCLQCAARRLRKRCADDPQTPTLKGKLVTGVCRVWMGSDPRACLQGSEQPAAAHPSVVPGAFGSPAFGQPEPQQQVATFMAPQQPQMFFGLADNPLSLSAAARRLGARSSCGATGQGRVNDEAPAETSVPDMQRPATLSSLWQAASAAPSDFSAAPEVAHEQPQQQGWGRALQPPEHREIGAAMASHRIVNPSAELAGGAWTQTRSATALPAHVHDSDVDCFESCGPSHPGHASPESGVSAQRDGAPAGARGAAMASHAGVHVVNELAAALDHRFEALMLSPDRQVPLLRTSLGRKLSVHGLDGGDERWGPMAGLGSQGPFPSNPGESTTSASDGAFVR